MEKLIAFPNLLDFRDSNCRQCKKCKEFYNILSENNCPIYMDLMEDLYLAEIRGAISMESARKIGFLDKENYKGKCLEFDPENPAPVAEVKSTKPDKVNLMNQISLF